MTEYDAPPIDAKLGTVWPGRDSDYAVIRVRKLCDLPRELGAVQGCKKEFEGWVRLNRRPENIDDVVPGLCEDCVREWETEHWRDAIERDDVGDVEIKDPPSVGELE